jgi:hypothetical protein
VGGEVANVVALYFGLHTHSQLGTTTIISANIIIAERKLYEFIVFHIEFEEIELNFVRNQYWGLFCTHIQIVANYFFTNNTLR